MTLRGVLRGACCALSALFSGVALADPVVDQEQPLVSESNGFLGIGGDAEQKLAQTFTVGVGGTMGALRLPVSGCNGDLIIDFVLLASDGRPGVRPLTTVRAAAADTPASPEGMAELTLSPRLGVGAGDRLAFTLRVEPATATCSLADSPDGDTYADGEAFFDARPNPPGWLARRETDRAFDLPFQTVMDEIDPPPPPPGGSARNCVIGPSGAAIPANADAPICRCLRDEGLRQFRCALLHPDFFMIRRLPWPIEPGASFIEEWEFIPIAPLDGPVRLTIDGLSRSKPAVREFGAKPGLREKLIVKNVAPKARMSLPGEALVEYKMTDAASPYETSFVIDRTLEEDFFDWEK